MKIISAVIIACFFIISSSNAETSDDGIIDMMALIKQIDSKAASKHVEVEKNEPNSHADTLDRNAIADQDNFSNMLAKQLQTMDAYVDRQNKAKKHPQPFLALSFLKAQIIYHSERQSKTWFSDIEYSFKQSMLNTVSNEEFKSHVSDDGSKMSDAKQNLETLNNIVEHFSSGSMNEALYRKLVALHIRYGDKFVAYRIIQSYQLQNIFPWLTENIFKYDYTPVKNKMVEKFKKRLREYKYSGTAPLYPGMKGIIQFALYNDEINNTKKFDKNWLSYLLRKSSNLYKKKKYMGVIVSLTDAIKIFKKKKDYENSIRYIHLLNLLGFAQLQAGQDFDASGTFFHSSHLSKRYLGTNHPLYAMAISGLAEIYQHAGDHDQSLKLNREALSILSNSLGENHPSLLRILRNLARQYIDIGESTKALSILALVFHNEALIYDKKTQYFEFLELLSELYYHQKKFSTSLKYSKLAHLAPRYHKKYWSKIDINKLNINRAHLLFAAGEYHKARQLYLSAMGPAPFSWIYSLLKEDPFIYQKARHNMALIEAKLGNYPFAIGHLMQSQKLLKELISARFMIMTESQQAKLLNDYEYIYNQIVSMALLNRGKMLNIAADMHLFRKSIILAAQTQNVSKIYNLGNRKEDLLKRLSLQRELATYQFAHLVEKQGVQNNARVAEIKEEISSINKRLVLKSEGIPNEIEIFKNNPQEDFRMFNGTLNRTIESIPADSALLEFAKIREFDWKKLRWTGNYRYVVFIIKRKSIKLIDIGNARSIEKSLRSNLAVLIDDSYGAREQLRAAGRLYQKIWTPLIAELDDVDTLYISPDAELYHLSFASLRNEYGEFLIESNKIIYVPSGKALYHDPVEKVPPTTKLVVFSSPDFAADKITYSNKYNLKLYDIPGSSKELDMLKKIIPGEKKVYEHEKATEEAFMKVHSPEILHISTHGFFLPTHNGNESLSENQGTLVRSGLVLTGAGGRASMENDSKSDGILTALEIAGMDLRGTKLVTLSACETGLGPIKNGEGVFGLRRAFSISGAKNILMSMWNVKSNEARNQMKVFYQHYQKGVSAADSLRQAQLDSIKKLRKNSESYCNCAPPIFWAPFIVQAN